MELLILVAAAVVLYLVTSSARSKQPANARSEQPTIKPTPGRQRFLAPIPKGYQVFASRLSIAGLHYRRQEALSFAAAGGQSLRFEREATNLHDENAIKLIGTTDAGEQLLGYVPREIARQVAEAELFESLKPRLQSIFVGNGPCIVDIEFQVIGPKSEKLRFDAYERR